MTSPFLLTHVYAALMAVELVLTLYEYRRDGERSLYWADVIGSPLSVLAVYLAGPLPDRWMWGFIALSAFCFVLRFLTLALRWYVESERDNTSRPIRNRVARKD